MRQHRLECDILEAETAVKDSTQLLELHEAASRREMDRPGASYVSVAETRPRVDLPHTSQDWRISAMAHLAKHAEAATEEALKATTGTGL